MKLVSERSETVIAQEAAATSVASAVRELTANLILVSRGAGKARDVGGQALALIESFQEYHDAFGRLPGQELTEFLDHDRLWGDVDWSRFDDDYADRHFATIKMVRGALQMTASSLQGQRSDYLAGERELHDGSRARQDTLARAEVSPGKASRWSLGRTAK
ncbi:MAG: hypothetical protein V4610_12590 [Pseudomonadota bacterium]|jgi:hypothetical protein|uniref:Uncharacterized protein n=1 Tax=hydrothermal vent metagenome TaxID=652676 RepID=A0A160TID0_9ZZZZ